jgi:cysteine desulfurase
MVMLKGIAAVSNGSACTSNSYTPSHVLSAMGLSQERIASSIRVSWSHQTITIPSDEICRTIKKLL